MMNKKIFLFVLLVSSVFVSCATIRNAGVNAVSDMLAGSDGKGRPLKRNKKSPDPMTAVMGESDTVLIGDFLPTALKMYEILSAQNPDHAGLAVMCGSLNVMYANAFIQAGADRLTDMDYDLKNSEYKRAKLHYLRGRDDILSVFDRRYPGFKAAMLGTDVQAAQKAVDQLKASDVNAAYWCASGALGAFSLDPLDADLLGSVRGPVLMLEKAAVLDPGYSQGAIWDVLSAFYLSAPSDFGGNHDRGLYCHEQALKISGGKTPGPYITYAESVCIPANDEKGFEQALKAALAIDPDADPSTRLSTIISQNKARYLLSEKDNYFVAW